jgi:hypothetical protein
MNGRLAPAALVALAAVSGVSAVWAQPAPAMPERYQSVLTDLDRKGDYKDNVLKVNVPRNDLKVTVDGTAVPTSLGFGGWIAMTKGNGGKDVMMGDLVLLQDEVNPVMSALLDNGLEVTALHNHFFWEEPRIFYMHVHGAGSPMDLARRVKPALDLIGAVKPRGSLPMTAAAPGGVSAGTMDTAAIARIAGHAGDQNGTVYKITVGRDDLHLKELGATINARMGLNTWAAFYGSDQDAVVAGDVAMLAGEITPVLKALRQNGLEVVSIHNHMIGTQPAVYFLHYWGRGPSAKLAAGFRVALDQLGKHRAGPMGMDHGGAPRP